jgi:signal peptidase II
MTSLSAPAAGRTSPDLRIVAIIALVVVALDQVVKALASRVVGPGTGREAYWVAGDWLGLDYVRNRGVAFGLRIGGDSLTLVLNLLAFTLACAVFWRMAGRSPVASAGLGLLAGGAIGNLIDRARFGYVVDFFAVGPWPRFNIADSAITIGIVLLAWTVLMPGDPGEQGLNDA